MPSIETDKYIFVHAGIHLTLDDWQKNYRLQESLARNHSTRHLITQENNCFYHTPVHGPLEQNQNFYELFDTEDGKSGMDGGAVYGMVFFMD